MPATIRRLRDEKRLIVILDRDDQRTLRELAHYEKLSLSDTVRRAIRAEARRIRSEKQQASA
jgi:hypothetical protein